MTTVGDGVALVGAGTTLGYGMPDGAGTLDGVGVGTTLGDGTAGAGVALVGAGTLAGDGVTRTTAGAGPATTVGADITAGEATMAATGTTLITTEVIMAEVTLT